jgi:hypothetical protein
MNASDSSLASKENLISKEVFYAQLNLRMIYEAQNARTFVIKMIEFKSMI